MEQPNPAKHNVEGKTRDTPQLKHKARLKQLTVQTATAWLRPLALI